MPDALERLKILLSSSTPIVVMETVEEMRAVRLVRSGMLLAESGHFRVEHRQRPGSLRQ